MGALSVLMTVGCSQSFKPRSALPRKRLAEEALGRGRVARRRKVELDGVAVLVHGPIQVGPLAPDLHVGLVHPPTGRAWHAPTASVAASPSRAHTSGPSGRWCCGQPRRPARPASAPGRGSSPRRSNTNGRPTTRSRPRSGAP